MKRPTISKRNFLKVVKSFEPCKQGLNRVAFFFSVVIGSFIARALILTFRGL